MKDLGAKTKKSLPQNIIGLWNELVGNQVELLLKNNLRQLGTVLEVKDFDGEMHLKFETKTPNTTVLLKHRDIKYIDPFLK